ncbi:MAG: RNA 2'-phosphotransferase [Archaeoglobaceae archaeon]
MDLGFCEQCGYFEGKCSCGKGRVILRSGQRVKISKFLSGLLRHFATDFGLKVDPEGWADINEVAKIVKEKYGVGGKEIESITEFDAKGRFQVSKGKIRARYGHSIDVRTDWTESEEIPPILYHATEPRKLNAILEKGLLPMSRREVHMCIDPQDAMEVGKRHSIKPVLLEVSAQKMAQDGYRIKRKGNIYTSDMVPPQYISVP